MKKCKICLSIAGMDEAFAKMYGTLRTHADVQIADLEHFSLEGTDVFIGKKLPAEKLAAADRLKAVFAYKTGVDDFPVGEFAKRGISLFNSHINSRYIAHYAFSLAAALVSRIAEFDRRMRQGDWANDNPYWKSLFNMKAGIVGYGHIGREIHALLRANGIESYTIDRGKDYAGIGTVASLEELCAAADILFLSLPKTGATDKMFDGKIFSLLRGKYIVNVGRSNCIDEAALYEALSSGALAGAAIDTWREKPATVRDRLKPFDYPFESLQNILLSSHKAMQLSDGHERYVQDVTENVLRYLNGERALNAVDCRLGY